MQTSSSEAVQQNSEGDKYIDLGKKKRATVRCFKDIPLLDIREFYGASSEEKPGKKGISLNLEQVLYIHISLPLHTQPNSVAGSQSECRRH